MSQPKLTQSQWRRSGVIGWALVDHADFERVAAPLQRETCVAVWHEEPQLVGIAQHTPTKWYASQSLSLQI